MSDRPLRSCDTCGVIDDHPRHVHDVSPFGPPRPDQEVPVNEDAVQKAYAKKGLSLEDGVRIVTDLRDTSVQTKHLDCCRADGCPTGDCDAMPEKMKDLRGYALVEAITGEKVK